MTSHVLQLLYYIFTGGIWESILYLNVKYQNTKILHVNDDFQMGALDGLIRVTC